MYRFIHKENNNLLKPCVVVLRGGSSSDSLVSEVSNSLLGLRVSASRATEARSMKQSEKKRGRAFKDNVRGAFSDSRF